MKLFKLKILIILTNLAFIFSVQSQERRQTNDTIDPEVVNVVKPYTPKVSDAFKVKEIPSIEDETTTTRKDVRYNIFSIPVASTFTPAKARAADVEKAKKEKLFDNYASIGVGTYTSILGEIYLNQAISRTESFGGYVSYHSSQGGIEDVLLDDKFSDTEVNINYARSMRDHSWNVDAGYRQQVYNWYGIPVDVHTDEAIASIDPQQKYFTFDFGGKIKFDDRALNNGSMRFRRFADNYESGENRFSLKTNLDIIISGEDVPTTFSLDYLGGTFNRSLFFDEEVKYGNFNIGLQPTYQIIDDDLTLNLGFGAYYLNDTENSKNKFYIYPRVTASYRLVNDVLIAYGGIEGDLIQNSYYDFASENPFLSPTQLIMPTDQQYDAYIGLKGKLSSNMSYNIRGNYSASNDRALYVSNPAQIGETQNYHWGNSFAVTYDDVQSFGVFGELNVDVNRNFNLGINAEYFNYSTDDEDEAWNLPDFEASLFMDYQINEHWFMGANLYYIGERLDNRIIVDILNPSAPMVVALESYFDANAHLGYRINDQWSIYGKANNIANQDYRRWVDYPVQGIQFLAGTTYKFDF